MTSSFATGDTLTLAGDVWCDVAEFAALMHGRDPADCRVSIRQMEEATQLWRGPLLAEIRLIDAPDFESWVRNERRTWSRPT